MGLVFQGGLAGKFCLGVTNEFAVKVSAGVAATWGLTGQEDRIPRWLTHMVCTLVLVVGKRLHFHSMGYFSVLVTQCTLLQSEQCQRARRSYEVFMAQHELSHSISSTVFCGSQATSDCQWERALKGCECQPARITAGHLQNLATMDCSQIVYWMECIPLKFISTLSHRM